ALFSVNFLQIYGQGSGLDCRHHVQKLNLLQGEAEEAIGWTFRRYVTMPKMRTFYFAVFSNCPLLQERRTEVSRWSRYLDKDSEDKEEVEEEAGAERQQFCSQGKNAVEKQRKHQRSILSSDVQEYAEGKSVFQLAYQAKKRKKCLVAVPDPGNGDAASGDTRVPAVCESVVSETTQPPSACTKSSKWEKFLSCPDYYSENAARVTLLPQEGSGRLGPHSTKAADAGMVSGCSEESGKTLPQDTVFQCKKHVASSERLASKLPGTMLPSTGCSVEEEMVFNQPESQLLRAGSSSVAERCSLDSTGRANTLVNCNTGLKPSNSSYRHLFCTGDEFDDDL
ncbi:MRNIP protein, partial [Bucco capensis]|nr:MRNIP protein [Bucco capensis]